MTKIMVILSVITIVGTLTSCEKEIGNEIESKVIAAQDATSVGLKQKKCCQCSCGPNPWATLGADFLGAMAGGEIGAFGGPIGIFIGSLAGGVAGSVSLWRSMNPQINFTPGNYGFNPYNEIGDNHNLLCIDIISNHEKYFNDDETLNLEYQNLIVQHCINLYPESNEDEIRSIDYNKIVEKINLYYFSGEDLSLISDSELSSFAEEFLQKLGNCANEDEAKRLIQNYENSVTSSNLPETKKQIILISLAVASHSNQLWD